jgi:hypothetical protein
MLKIIFYLFEEPYGLKIDIVKKEVWIICKSKNKETVLLFVESFFKRKFDNSKFKNGSGSKVYLKFKWNKSIFKILNKFKDDNNCIAFEKVNKLSHLLW